MTIPEVWLGTHDQPLSMAGWGADTTVNLAVLADALAHHAKRRRADR